MAKVLSTMTAIPSACAWRLTSAMSTTSTAGLVGLSSTTRRLRGPATSRRRSRSAGATRRLAIPHRGTKSRTKRVVPP